MMNKKVLAITLVLVMAFASSAMAAVNFSGKFTATAEQKNFKVFQEGYSLTPGFEFTMGASNKNETEEVLNWDFSAGIKLNTNLDVDFDEETATSSTSFALGKYKLGLYDNYFTAYVWGNGQELSDKATYFGMINAGKAASAMKARVEVPVMDLAKVTVDFEQPNNLRAFVEGSVEGFDLGVAYARKGWTTVGDTTTATDVIVGQVGTAVPAGDLTINAKAAAGVVLGDKLGIGLGFSADTKLTDELKIEGSVTNANEHWLGADGLTAKNTVLSGKVTYEEAAFQATASVKHTLVKDVPKGSNELTLGARYRMSTNVAYGNLFHNDHWYKSTAPAAGVSAKFVDLKFDNVRADATYPIVDDMVFARAYATYNTDKKFTAGADARILATEKLTLLPGVGYKSDGKAFDAKLVAKYLIGLSATELSLEASKTFNEAKDGPELIKATITVPF